MAKDVSITFGGEMTELKNSLQSMESYVKGWGSSVKNIVGGAFSVVAIKEIISTGAEWVAGANEAAAVQAKLAAVVEATGGAAGFTADEMADMAREMRQITGIDDDLIKGAQTVIATFKEIRGDTFDRTTMAAADLAAVLGGDVQGAAMQLGKALNDPIKGMTMLAKSGVGFTADQAKLIESFVKAGEVAKAQGVILAEVEAQVGGAAAAANEANGPWEEFGFIIGDLAETGGNLLNAILDPMLPMLESGALLVSEWTAAFEAALPTITAFVEDGIEGVIASTAYLWAVAEVVWKDMPDLIGYAFDSSKLSALGFFNDLTFFFTDTVPAVLSWFADNWREIFSDIYMYVGTVLNNMFENVVTFFTGVWDWLAGNEASFEFRALSEGFEATLKELPKIAERELSATEQALIAKTASTGDKIAKSFNDKFNEKLDFLGFGENGESGPATQVAAATPKKSPPDRATPGSKGEKEKEFKAGFEDLGSLFNRIQSSAATPEAKAAEKTAAAVERGADEQKQTTTATKDVNGTLKAIQKNLERSLTLG